MSKQPPRRALIVVDVQIIEDKFQIELSSAQDLLSRIEHAMDVATDKGIPIVVVQHVVPPAALVRMQGSRGTELHPRIAARHRDLLLAGTLPSCFAGTRLGEWLDDRSIDTLVIVGCMTRDCHHAIVGEALHRGYQVELLHDAARSMSDANEAGPAAAGGLPSGTCAAMQPAYAAVMSTAEWAEAVNGGGTLGCANIHVSSRRAAQALPAGKYTRTFFAGWSDMDCSGQMRNTAFLEKATEARNMFMDDGGFPPAEFMRLGVGPIVMKDEVSYFSEIHLQQRMEVTLELSGLSPDGSRFLLRHEISRGDGTLSARITSTGGWFDLVGRKLVRPPPAILSLIDKLARTSDFSVVRSNVRESTSAGN